MEKKINSSSTSVFRLKKVIATQPTTLRSLSAAGLKKTADEVSGQTTKVKKTGKGNTCCIMTLLDETTREQCSSRKLKDVSFG